jgi:RNA polymerase sigma factor (sigma-70 family)
MMRVQYSDQELLEGIYSRDSRVVRYIMELMWEPVRNLILKNNGEETDALQIIEEAIVSIYTKPNKLELTSKFKTYFVAICKNMWLNELRNRKNEPDLTNDYGVQYQENEISEKKLYEKRRRLYLKYLRKIPEVCQSILKMIAEGFSNEQITDELAFSSIQYMKNRKSVCNKRLLELIQADPKYKELKHGL